MSVQQNPVARRPQPDSLADVLERVLDKGVVIAGDIVVNLLDIELLTLKLRLFIASADTAREMGMDWWTTDPFFSPRVQRDGEQLDERSGHEVDGADHARLERENRELRRRLAELEGAGREETQLEAGGTGDKARDGERGHQGGGNR
jgi:hypothetical protein